MEVVQALKSGDGIASKILDHMLDRFYFGEDTTNISGLGIILVIVKSLLEGLGEKIRMEIQLGCELNFEIPILQ